MVNSQVTRGVAALLQAKLGPDQELLLHTLLMTVVVEGRADDQSWPPWQFVQRSLEMYEVDARRIFDSLPTLVGHEGPYGLVWRSMRKAGPRIRLDETVSLTLAGLHHIDPERAVGLAQLFARVADEEARLPLDLASVVTGSVRLGDIARAYLDPLAQRARATSMTVCAAIDLLSREPIPISAGPKPDFQVIVV